MATLSTALGALFGAARILQAIARDDILPVGFFRTGSKIGDEPRCAVILTWLISNVFAYLGKNSINGLSQILTDFFLTAYALVNLSQLLLTLSKAPNYRPTFNWSTWYSSLLAFVLSIALMWFLNPLYAGITTGMWFTLFFGIKLTERDTDWGDISQAVLFRSLVSQLKSLVTRKDNAKFWRSSVLLLTQDSDLPLLTFGKHLTKNGLYIIGSAHLDAEDKKLYATTAEDGMRRRTLTQNSMLPNYKSPLSATKAALLWVAETAKLDALVSVGAGANVVEIFRTMISCAGLGGLVPNTVIVPFKAKASTGPFRNYVARIDEQLRKHGNDPSGKPKYTTKQPWESNVLNHPASQNSDLGIKSNTEYVRLLKLVKNYEKNLMVVRNIAGMEALFRGLWQKHTILPTNVDVWIVGEWEWSSLEESVTLLIQHAHLMQGALGKRTSLRIHQLVHYYYETEKAELLNKLKELVETARIPMPEICVHQAPAVNRSERRASFASSSSEISPEHCAALNSTIKQYSPTDKTAIMFLALPTLPEEVTDETANSYMHCVESLSADLPPCAMLMKGDPLPVFSTHI